MKKNIVITIILVVVIFIGFFLVQKYANLKLPSLNSPTPSYPSADKLLNIFIRDSKFIPNASAMPLGVKVTWYNEDDKNHNVTGDNWESGILLPGQSFSKIFDQTGDFKYHCSIHPEMTGEIIVK